ncbi:protein-tyrosine phosphatase [Parafrankia irregularis]|uniref:Protein-tyrosine phosphatase n=2 Tax=Parafrankia irregularis TaxID=795642 RepID=A0A0S4QGH3_9ACTN|nr:protein tyrosine phosphatase [Parafrankia sp. CH37]MBE3199531.1 protein tyrosine phosphatase [Parafrankia sp. CH37]CUU53804.1 protein-tyrosine phosphatase [Parafrankia irregularis]
MAVGHLKAVQDRASWSVLIVCTGNICRSPVAERLAVAGLTRLMARVGLREPLARAAAVSSAGVQARVGEPMHPLASAVLDEHGVDDAGFRARQLTTAMAERADLVLCATRQHRADVVTLAPRAVRRSFTLREFARLADWALADGRLASLEPEVGIQPEHLRVAGMALTDAAAAARGMTRPSAPEHDDIADPLGGNLEAFRDCADIIDAAVRSVETVLTSLLLPHPAAVHRGPEKINNHCSKD